MLFYRYMPFLLIFLLIFSLFYAFFLAPSFSSINLLGQSNSYFEDEKIKSAQQCEEGSRISCVITSCYGYKICRNGVLSECIIEKICNPNSKAICAENFCSTGYKICNECGTAYSDCIYQK